MKQAVEKKREPNGTMPTKKPRDVPPLEVGIPATGKLPTLEVRGNCKTIVDWVNGNGTMPTKKPRDVPPLEVGIPATGKLPTLEIRGDCKTIVDWVTKTFCGNGVDEVACDNEPPSGSFIPFVNTRKKPTCGQTRVRRGVWKNWVDTTQIAWPEVTGLCEFWYWSCDNGSCGAAL